MHNQIKRSLLSISILMMSYTALSQNTLVQIKSFLQKEAKNLNLKSSDIQDIIIYNEHTSNQNGITFSYAQQQYLGVPIFNAVANFAIKDKVVSLAGNRFLSSISDLVKSSNASINSEDAINYAVSQLAIPAPESYSLSKSNVSQNKMTYESKELSNEIIPVQLMYFLNEEAELILVWDLSIQELSGDHWWSVRIDANTGELIDKVDWVVSCKFEGNETHAHKRISNQLPQVATMLPAPPPGTDQYNVIAIPTESPNHGPRTMVVGPADLSCSPYGWHDVNGVDGPEYTITRGNNVYATEDSDDNNSPGYAPDGGGALNFDFPLDLNQLPTGYYDPAITNLFYMNNIMHDVWYHYGFDEASGNFQENNYGNGGLASDFVDADAQDAGGTNNANFSTPPDGQNPRMQMYLWSPPGGPPSLFSINSPAPLAGSYTVVEADFGPGIPAVPITSDVVVYEDATGDIHDACELPINGPSMSGKIAILRRSSCSFVSQITKAQDEGAIGVIVVDNVPGPPFAMTGSGSNITIPAVLINQFNGENIISEISGGGTVNCTIGNANGPFELDGDFDNGIIAHEYGHGISTRLTGGAGNSGCLWNEEQMGEGWSDWFGLMLTIEPGDQEGDVRGIGTFASGESVTGGGIRPAPYSTNWSINGYTYAATNSASISQPHGIGFVWATMIWDLNWALINQYGLDPDVYNGTGGNNMAMHLVITGLKLQPCGPGFVDARDAIIQADQLLYGGANECLIWKVFAKRGLGYSAQQGDTDDRTDQVQAFDLPPSISNTTDAVACDTYTWAENGQTYTASGTYTSPIASAGVGCDTVATLNLTIGNSGSVNVGYTQLNSITIHANSSIADYIWLDCDNNYAILAGETNQNFVASANGNYAVQITENECVDTSICVNINSVGIIENGFGYDLIVYPNPTDGLVTVELGKEYDAITAKVFDMNGKLVSEKKALKVKSIDVTINGTVGTYVLEITSSDDKRAQIRILKQ